jgi:hypothetical protein
MAIVLTDEIREHVNGALVAGNPMIVATVDEAGQPRLSFRGSVAVYSDDQLGFWARNPEGQTVGGLGSNPHVAFMYRSPAQRVMLQFAGRARLATGAERDTVFENAPEFEQRADPERKGVGVIVDLDKVEGLLGLDADGNRRPVRMLREG